nr:sulfotransferase ssu-1-like isoform X2 [Dermacentor andersoni]
MDFTRAPVYQVIDGLKYSKVYRPEHVRAVRAYTPQDDDLVLVSYLKCGNNWLEQIIQLILHGGESAANYAEFHRWCPYPELCGLRYLEEMEPPRFFKTHFRYEHQLKNPKAKFVYLARNPLDVCTSFYYYVLKGPQYDFKDCSFNDFVEAFVSGEVDRGDYLDHLLSWYPHRHEQNVLFITFEQLKQDFRGTVLSLASFMGEKYRRLLANDQDVYRMVVEKSNLSFMSKLCSVDKDGIAKLTEKDEPFLDACRRFNAMNRDRVKGPVIARKGIVGDWKNHFTNRHLGLVRQWIEKKEAAQVIREIWGDLDLGGIV